MFQNIFGSKSFPIPVKDQLTVTFEAPAQQKVQIRFLDRLVNALLKPNLAAIGGAQQIKLWLYFKNIWILLSHYLSAFRLGVQLFYNQPDFE
ncbi:hypothetical protein [Adhaeribacter radiodurans]|uniref:Uncharacterized protein n=1 Tax=Adhaeribacter radiodurans TaxID=2745197 RepID=A0A7L7LA88_9BACT|nr:hypothetical protein [Adhaeribacter radiodurans]QMU29751.1 hypothetical protein HUW48_17740 [Adhaeribacter radiodurans]